MTFQFSAARPPSSENSAHGGLQAAEPLVVDWLYNSQLFTKLCCTNRKKITNVDLRKYRMPIKHKVFFYFY